MLGANVAGHFKLKLLLIYHSENPRALKNFVKPVLLVLDKWNNKASLTARLFAYGLLNILSPLLRPTAQEKRFKILLIDNCT